jgi:NRAMP (natural resistance-associated macrophage protein)-like metal ion transporter
MASASDTVSAPAPAPSKTCSLAELGPGLITGAADDDPSGIATYSQVGAQFGYGLGWTLIFSLPLMIAIQLASGRIGVVTGKGIGHHIRTAMPTWVGRSIVTGLLVANIFNIGADLSAMGDAVSLVTGGRGWAWAIVVAITCVSLEVLVSYRRYQAALKWVAASLLAYVGVLFVVRVPWGSALHDLLIPSVGLDRSSLLALAAVLGTTISPYLFFWQAGQQVEEERRRGVEPLMHAPAKAQAELARLRFDTNSGMLFSNLIALFIVFATSATLHAHGVHMIATAADAAQALRPIAGRFAFLLFTLGIVGIGLLAIPVLAGSAAYAVAELVDKPEGLDLKPNQAGTFYGVIGASVACGLALELLPIPPMVALYWAAILNGILAAPMMAVIMLLASSRTIMGEFPLPVSVRVLGWLGVLAMAAVAIGALAQI